MRTSIAAIALIRREEAGQTFWLAQWNDGWQAYSFVGGHKHDDETFRECAIREIGEELGLVEGRDVLVASAPLEHLEYTDVSRRTGDQTAYVMELYDVALVGDRARSIIDGNPANRWLSETEIMSGRCDDGKPVSPTPKRFLEQLGWDLFVSYAHKDDEPDGWVTALVQAIRAEHAEFTPTPLRVFFDRREIRTMDDWERRILDGLHASKLMLAVLSEHYFRSDYCKKEWAVYRDHEIRRQMLGESIAPIYIVTVPGFDGNTGSPGDEWQADLRQRADLSRRQYLDVRPWRPQGVAALRQLEVRERLRSLDQQIAERLARARRAEESKNTVPRASDRFVGRHAELARLRELLPQGKVAAITAVQGIGGIGKTALAFLYSQAFADHYPGGRFLIEAAGLNDLRIVLVRLAADLGIEFTDTEQKDLDTAAARVRTTLEQRARSLLIVDNVDQLDLLQPRNRTRVLPATDRLHLLATTRMAGDDLAAAGVDCLPLDPLPEADALELLNRHRAIAGDDEWKAALRIARLLGGHTLALEVVAVYLWKYAEVTYRDYLARLEGEGLFAALSGTGADRAVQLSEKAHTLIGPLLEPTLAGLQDEERRALEYAAHLPPDAVSVPWVHELVSGDFPERLAIRPGYADPWRDVVRRLTGLRLWTVGEDRRVVRTHRIVQEVVAARTSLELRDERRRKIREHVSRRAEVFGRSANLSELLWEVEPLRDYALLRMAADEPHAVHVAQWLCDRLHDLGRLTDAGQLAQSAVECGQRLAAAAPGNAGWQRDLSVSQNKLGDVLSAQGDLTAALTAYRGSLEIRQRLAAADPGNAGWQRDLSASHDRFGDVLSAQGDLTAALAAYRATHEILQRLAAADPGNAGWQFDLGISHERIGAVLQDKGDLAGALAAFQRKYEIIARLAAADPGNAGWQRDLSVSHNKLGDVLSAQGDLTAALAAYRASLEIRRRLAAADPGNAGWQRDLSVSQNKLGDVLSAQGDLTAALAAYRATHEILRRLAAADPGNAGWQRDLSVSQEKLGDVLSAQGDLTAALAAYRGSLEISQRLAAADPGNAGWQRDLWVSYWRLATIAEQQGGDGAHVWWQQACDVLSAMKERRLFLSSQDEECLIQIRRKLGQ
jgi:tetratricopeptide (TPR) repeat protein/ADP-ribose pyrophosphatase YjhB (NUDIX family)